MAVSTIDADAWFDENVKSAAQDEDQYRRLLKMKTEAREGLHSAFENHVARVAEKVERLRIVHDAVVKLQQDSLRLDLQAQAENNNFFQGCRKDLAVCQLGEKLKGRPLTTWAAPPLRAHLHLRAHLRTVFG